MKNLLKLLIISVFLLSGCFSSKNTFTTVHISDADSTMPSGVIYSLPRTGLSIQVELLEVRTYRGPYFRFAEKYLGIADVPVENYTEWYITGVKANVFQEVDPDQYYLIYSKDDPVQYDEIIKLTNAGLVFDMNKFYQPAESQIMVEPDIEAGVLYTDLSVKRNIELSTDTLYKTILTDTSFIRVPVLKQQLISKTIDEKAEEAANFIIKTRKRRFKLMAGQYDFYPDESALEFGVQRLDEIEKEYLSLFTGKKVELKHSLQFDYIPDPSEVFENVELFEYDKLSGITSTGDGKVVNLLIKKENTTKHLEDYKLKSSHDNLNKVFYRIPDIAIVEIQDGGKSILKERIPVFQYGTILSLPIQPKE